MESLQGPSKVTGLQVRINKNKTSKNKQKIKENATKQKLIYKTDSNVGLKSIFVHII